VSVLLITNDFPPRAGGIQQYCHNLVRGLPPGEVVVYAPAWPGAEEFDAAEAYRIVRHPTSRMLPTASVANRAIELIREVRPDLVCFGAAFPLGLLARRLTRATGVPCVGFTHGVEVAVSGVPLVRRLMTRVAGDLRLLTAVSRWSAARVERGARAAARWSCCLPGWRPGSTTPGSTGRRCGRATGSARTRCASVCRGWCRAKGRTG